MEPLPLGLFHGRVEGFFADAYFGGDFDELVTRQTVLLVLLDARSKLEVFASFFDGEALVPPLRAGSVMVLLCPMSGIV